MVSGYRKHLNQIKHFRKNTINWMKSNLKNIIIGAGPGGLAVAGSLRQQGQDFEILEGTDKIASTWHNHYDRLCLHTVKELSFLPGLPFPADYPRYVPRKELVKYYEDYARHFQIKPHFKEEVVNVQRSGTHWEVKTKSGKVFVAENVITATGVNRIPFSPKWEGQESYQGKLIHSRAYKNPDDYHGQRVLIIGMGNTGAELALDCSENDIDVSISVRSAVNIVPRDLNGRPTQLTARQLAKLPFGLGDWLGTQIRKRVVGDLSKYGLETATIPPARQLKETGKTPVIDLGTVEHIKAGRIKILPDIARFHEDGVTFVDGTREQFDRIILATGYRAKVNNFIPGIEDFLDQYNIPQQAVGTGNWEGLYFIGFDNYKLGGILGTINTDSNTIVKHILNKG